MVHKIQTAENTYLSLEIIQTKSEPFLRIAKNDSILTFNYEQIQKLNAIVQTIDPSNYTLKEYGTFKK